MSPLDPILSQIEADLPAVKSKLDGLAAQLAAANALLSTSLTPEQLVDVQSRLTAVEAALKAFAA